MLLIGPPGVGKTMLATALGHEAVHARQTRLLHHRSRPRRPMPQSSHRRQMGNHHALLQRPERAHHRRTRLPAHARRRRQRPLPSHQPEIPQRLHHLDHRPRRRQLGRHLRRHHRRRRHARQTPTPIRRLQHHRRQLPTPSPPSPQQTTHQRSYDLSSQHTQGGEFR